MLRSIIAGFCAMSMRPLAFFAVLSVAAIVHAAVAPAPPAAELPQPVSAATPAAGFLPKMELSASAIRRIVDGRFR